MTKTNEWTQDRAPFSDEVIWQSVPAVIGQAIWSLVHNSPDFTAYSVAGGSIMCTSRQTWAGNKQAPVVHCETPFGSDVTTYRVAVGVINPDEDED